MPRADANIILRYLADEPQEQADRVGRLLRRAADGRLVLRVDDITVAEVIWTLTTFFHLPRGQASTLMLSFLDLNGIECQSRNVVQQALVLFADKRIDFADALLCARMLDEGQTEIYSFDRDLDRVAGIRRIEP